MKKKIFIPYPSQRDIRELALLKEKVPYHVILDSYTRGNLEYDIQRAASAQDVHALIERSVGKRVAFCKEKGIHGLGYSNDYPTNPLSILIAQQAGLRAPDLALILSLHHKYYSRKLQEQYVAEAVPAFDIIPFNGASCDIALPYPFFIKPVKSYLSMGAYHVADKNELDLVLKKQHLPLHFLEPFNYLLRNYSRHEHDSNHMIAESLLAGDQVTLEGYVFNGACHMLGVTDSIMYPGTQSFERFIYPTRLPPAVVCRMQDITRRLIAGIGLDNTLFNIEFMYDKEHDTISIIEINPRMAHQFADLYEKVDGTNSYQIMLDIAAGIEPRFVQGNGTYGVAASCVLRTFENKRVRKAPSAHEVRAIAQHYPDIRIELYAVEGSHLGEQDQDTASYRYAILNVGGKDLCDLNDRVEQCKNQLSFTFEPISNSQ